MPWTLRSETGERPLEEHVGVVVPGAGRGMAAGAQRGGVLIWMRKVFSAVPTFDMASTGVMWKWFQPAPRSRVALALGVDEG